MPVIRTCVWMYARFLPPALASITTPSWSSTARGCCSRGWVSIRECPRRRWRSCARCWSSTPTCARARQSSSPNTGFSQPRYRYILPPISIGAGRRATGRVGWTLAWLLVCVPTGELWRGWRCNSSERAPCWRPLCFTFLPPPRFVRFCCVVRCMTLVFKLIVARAFVPSEYILRVRWVVLAGDEAPLQCWRWRRASL